MSRSTLKGNTTVADIAPTPVAVVMGKPASPIPVERQVLQVQDGTLLVAQMNGKGQPTERDSVNALLSLGRDLPAEEAEAMGASGVDNTGDSTTAADTGSLLQSESKPSAKRPPQPILPEVLAAKPAKKRQRKSKNAPPCDENVKGERPDEAPAIADFWFWLPDGESVGEWDVLCGRGGESNNFIGNRRFRNMVHARKAAYREIPIKQRKAKTAFVKSIVHHINSCGGRFVDLDFVTGKYFVVTMEKARKKASQALRETKELKWLELSDFEEPTEETSKNDNLCPFCNQPGHKTKIAKACLEHHEWMAAADTVKPPSTLLLAEENTIIDPSTNI